MKIKNRNKDLFVKVKKLNPLGQVLGLMFHSRNTENLIFNSVRIHSLFVFFSFVAVWLHDNRVIKAQIVRPFTLSVHPPKDATSLLEIPISKKNARIIKLLVGK